MLGSIHDIRAIAEEVHKVEGARLCVDGVAYAPHGEVDVRALGMDFYSFSWYKVRFSHPIPFHLFSPLSHSSISLSWVDSEGADRPVYLRRSTVPT